MRRVYLETLNGGLVNADAVEYFAPGESGHVIAHLSNGVWVTLLGSLEQLIPILRSNGAAVVQKDHA